MNYAAYIQTAKELFERIPKKSYVLKYHELEQLSKEVGEQEIKLMKDLNVRETLKKVKHVHDDIAKKKGRYYQKD